MSHIKNLRKKSGIRFQKVHEFMILKKLSILQKLDFACNAKLSKIQFSLKNWNSIQNVFHSKIEGNIKEFDYEKVINLGDSKISQFWKN